MDPQSVLVLAAELGVGIAGFSSIAAALGSRTSSAQREVRRAQVVLLVGASLAVSFFAYLPMVLALALPESLSFWRVASTLYAAWHIFILIRFVLRNLASRQTATRFRWFTAFTIAIAVSLNIYNVVLAGVGWPYLASLACGLLVAGTSFIQLIGSVVGPVEQMQE